MLKDGQSLQIGSSNVKFSVKVGNFNTFCSSLELKNILLQSLLPIDHFFARNMSKLASCSIRTILVLVKAFAFLQLVLITAMGLLLDLVVAMRKRTIVTELASVVEPILANFSLFFESVARLVTV